MTDKLFEKVIWPKSGRYIIAVSGGVDSVCLLDVMTRARQDYHYELIIAHFDHGLRTDSSSDADFVKELAQQYDLEFVVVQGKLGRGASEARAREARYKFLESTRRKQSADGVLSAHHFDDVLETAIFNAGRGASDEGLTPMNLNVTPLRPFLQLRKDDLLAYAENNNLRWRDDPTNKDLRIARNFIRHRVVPLLTAKELETVRDLVQANQLRQKAGEQTAEVFLSGSDAIKFPRERFLTLDNDQATLLIKIALRRLGLFVERENLSALVNFAKVAANGKQFQGSSKLRAHIRNDMITLAKNPS